MPKISKVKYKANGSAQLFFEDEPPLTVPDTVAYDENLRKGVLVDEVQYEELAAKAKLHFAMLRAMGSLAAKSFSQKGLVRRLREKGVGQAEATEAAAFFTEKGYVDDARYAEDLVASLHNVKLYGSKRISQELWQKGISAEVSEPLLEDLDDEEILEKRLEKKYRNVDFQDRKENNRVYQALIRAGFSHSLVAAALRQRGIEAEEDWGC